MNEPEYPEGITPAEPTAADRELRVLIVADPELHVALVSGLSGELAGDTFKPTVTAGLSECQQALAKESFDCVLLDLGCSDNACFEFLARLRAQVRSLPIVVRVDRAQASLESALIAAGAEDTVLRSGDTGQLMRALSHSVARNRLRQRNAVTELALQRERDRRDVRRLLGDNKRAGEAARIYGAATLKELDPQLFDQIVREYLELVKYTADSQVFRTEDPAPSARTLAENLGFLGAGPRDAIEVHTEALLRLERELGAAEHGRIALEGRIVVLELMGYLAAYYRRYYLNSMPFPRRADNVAGQRQDHYQVAVRNAFSEPK